MRRVTAVAFWLRRSRRTGVWGERAPVLGAAEIALVMKPRALPGTPATFQRRPLERERARRARLRCRRPTRSQAADAARPVSIELLDATLVDALGLHAAAREFSVGAMNAGLRPPARFGHRGGRRLLACAQTTRRARTPSSSSPSRLRPAPTRFSAARLLTLAQPARGIPAGAATNTACRRSRRRRQSPVRAAGRRHVRAPGAHLVDGKSSRPPFR